MQVNSTSNLKLLNYVVNVYWNKLLWFVYKISTEAMHTSEGIGTTCLSGHIPRTSDLIIYLKHLRSLFISPKTYLKFLKLSSYYPFFIIELLSSKYGEFFHCL